MGKLSLFAELNILGSFKEVIRFSSANYAFLAIS
jgi:hypothetical protein